jgi:hypothetical protein
MSALRNDLKRLTIRVSRLQTEMENIFMAIADDLNTELSKHSALIQQVIALLQQLAANQNGSVPDSTVQAAINALAAQDAAMQAVLPPVPPAVPTNGAASATPTT